jgi:tRNA pseudouridine55 synthase
MAAPKTYLAEMQFGAATDTQDAYGAVLKTSCRVPNIEELRKCCRRFIGEITQIPPMYSAIKHQGKKLYQLARKGQNIAVPPRSVTIYDINLRAFDETRGRCMLEVSCSKGTYIRTLCIDMARDMGALAYLSFLSRTESAGAFLSNTYTLEEVAKLSEKGKHDFLTPIEEALSFLGRCALDDYLFPILTTGSPIALEKTRHGGQIPAGRDLLVYCKDILVGIGRRELDTLRIQTMLYIK